MLNNGKNKKIDQPINNMKLWKYSGTLLMATGVLHIILAIIRNYNIYREIFLDKLLNSVSNDVQRSLAFWFLMIGVLLILWGQTLQYYIKRESQPAPLFTGYALLIMSIIGCLMIPISGFWLFLPQAFIIILAKRNKN